MRAARLFPIVLLLAACAAAPTKVTSVSTSDPEVMTRVAELLSKYEKNDQEGVIAMLDTPFVIQGSDMTVVRTAGELRGLMSRDFSQWGRAKLSDVRAVDLRSDGALATVHFLMSFQAGDGPSVPIHVASTWHKVNGVWLLAQSASSVPERG